MSQDETRHSCGWYSVTQLLGLCIYSSRRMRSTLCCRINGPVKLGLGGTEQCKHLPLGETPFFTTELGFSAFYNILEASKILFCKNACSIFVISTETGRSGTVERGDNAPVLTWMMKNESEGKVARDSWHQPALVTPFYPQESFFFSFFFAFLTEIRSKWMNQLLRGRVTWIFVNFNTPLLLQQCRCLWPGICNSLHVLVKLLLAC